MRRATLICSLHHVEFARAYFPRIIGLREGRIVFDTRSVNVTDAMVKELYQNEHEVDSSAEFQPPLNINAPGF